MNRPARLFRSSVGSKALVALTGALLLLFVILHMLGNLQVFLGQEALNSYAQKIQDLGPLLWAARLGLLAVFLVHIGNAVKVWRGNREARPEDYVCRATVQTTPAARSMILTGSMVAAFVIYHLLHFTFGAIQPEHHELVDAAGRHDVYSMVVLGFSNFWVSAFYIVANVLLGLHLSHGATSMFKSLGVTHPRVASFGESFGPAIATIIVLGNVAMPLACLIGLVPLPEGVVLS